MAGEEQVIMLRKQGGDDKRAGEREAMVRTQIERRGVKDARVLEAMRKVPRHLFIPPDRRDEAYGDFPLPIGHGQTISQPYIVALMTELLRLKPESRVLEIGTGSGYQAAVLAELAAEVYSIEIVEPLCEKASELLAGFGYTNARVRCGDGFYGWPEEAPYDGIIVTAAPEKVPQPLLDQLADGGRLVIPEGRFLQELVVYEKHEGEVKRREVISVRFVPMTGRAEKQ
ncbi:MAG: protein-L-isoaspartate(D-aspartate) O-methyltransferase [Candidatus Glassbacteria bacterium]|nr:protein-L-isoaspartate(D-aspartate) O-methyltransferase [Candidatus Glassbacteria bacterium]